LKPYKQAGRNLPLFVCNLVGPSCFHTVPRLGRFIWPANSDRWTIISEISLGIFLTMSLMSLQALGRSLNFAGADSHILAAQFVVAFPLRHCCDLPCDGPRYEVLCLLQGFGGFLAGGCHSHGRWPHGSCSPDYGPAHRAFHRAWFLDFRGYQHALVFSASSNWAGLNSGNALGCWDLNRKLAEKQPDHSRSAFNGFRRIGRLVIFAGVRIEGIEVLSASNDLIRY